jgi:hypothetical protein
MYWQYRLADCCSGGLGDGRICAGVTAATEESPFSPANVILGGSMFIAFSESVNAIPFVQDFLPSLKAHVLIRMPGRVF